MDRLQAVQQDETELSSSRESAATDVTAATLTPSAGAGTTPIAEGTGCPNCGGTPSEESANTPPRIPIYALGRIEARFPSPAIEKEFLQAVGRSDSSGQTNQEALHEALSRRENRYLARKLCWVLKVQGIETYILVPMDPADIELLVDAIRPAPSPLDIDVVIGRRGPIAPPEVCNGLMIPIVAFEQIYSFDSQTLIKSIPKPERAKGQKFEATAQELLRYIIDNLDNAGAADADRARNYLLMRYPAIYVKCFECQENELSLRTIETKPSHLSGTRNLVDVILSFSHRKTDVTEKYFVRVDVTEEFPFLVSKLSPYFDR